MADCIGPVKMAIRQDNDAGIIRAFISMADESEMGEFSQMSLALAYEDQESFELWKDACAAIMRRWVERKANVKVKSMTEIRAHDLN